MIFREVYYNYNNTSDFIIGSQTSDVGRIGLSKAGYESYTFSHRAAHQNDAF